jgi:hypothetical protein
MFRRGASQIYLPLPGVNTTRSFSHILIKPFSFSPCVVSQIS